MGELCTWYPPVRGQNRGEDREGSPGSPQRAQGKAAGRTALLFKAPRTCLTYFALLSPPVCKEKTQARGPRWAPGCERLPQTLGAEVDYIKALVLQGVFVIPSCDRIVILFVHKAVPGLGTPQRIPSWGQSLGSTWTLRCSVPLLPCSQAIFRLPELVE